MGDEMGFGFRRALAVVVMFLAAPAAGHEEAVLDRYVAAPDPDYRYKPLDTIDGDAATGYLLDLTSQRWRTAAEVDRPVWRHWLTIIRPEHVETGTALLAVRGGANGSGPPTRLNPLLASLAARTGSVVAELRMVPNQPLVLAGETRQRSEDALAASSWVRYLRTGDDGWPLQLPMTKSIVRAMDTVTAFCRTARVCGIVPDRFVIEGASKRGWATWLAAAADGRVLAIVPLVADLLNLETSFAHHRDVYGFWAPALHDYEEMGITQWRGTAPFHALASLVDPYAYRDRLTMPKLIINAAGDQFFLPDSSQFYFDGLSGEKYLRYVPNTDHSLRGSDASETAQAFYEAIVAGTPRPRFSWQFAADGSIEVRTETAPSAVKLWQATNARARDFRFEAIGPAFISSDLEDQGGGVYIGKPPRPDAGWIAYFIELTYPSGRNHPLKLTTGVRVLPAMGAPAPQPTAHQSR